MRQRLQKEFTGFGILPKEIFVQCTATQKLVLTIVGVCLMGLDSFLHSIFKSQHSLSSFGFGVFLAAVILNMVETWRFRHRKRVPRNARFLILLLMPNATGDALLGDLEERFERIANDKTLGPYYAHFWY